MSEVITEADALHRYPELQELVTIRAAGWVFRSIDDDNGGEVIGIAGSYSRQRYTDALFIFDRTNVAAARVLDQAYGGGCVWKREGADLQEVVRDLLGLPEPGARLAPHLVIAKSTSLPWTP